MDLRFPSVFSEDVTMRIVGALQVGKGWAMDLRFPSVFSEDVTMWMDADCGCGFPLLVPSRLAEDGRWIFAFPLYSARM